MNESPDLATNTKLTLDVGLGVWVELVAGFALTTDLRFRGRLTAAVPADLDRLKSVLSVGLGYRF